MSEWAFVVTPLLVLPIVLLFRFVGCGLNVVGQLEPEIPLPPRKPPPDPAPVGPPQTPPAITTPPRYRDYIMGAPNNPGAVKHPTVVPNPQDVVAYWRLVDPSSQLKAKDEKGFQDGAYKTGTALAAQNPSAAVAGSEAAPGSLLTGQTGLILSDPPSLCRFFNGGYMLVEFKASLYTDEFTIEAWVKVKDQVKLDYEHTLFQAGGRYALGSSPVGYRGFRIFETRDGRWQVQLAPGDAAPGAAPPTVFPGTQAPLIPRPGPTQAPTHLAVTVANAASGGKDVTLYVDGKPIGPVNVDAYARPDTSPLYIGLGDTDPSGAIALRYPMLSHIQEVVLHRKALSLEEIQNHVDINRPS